MKIQHIILSAALGLGLAACSGGGWKVDGNIAGLEKGTKLALEAGNGNSWYLLDSLEIGSNGHFSYKAEAPLEYTDIMRITDGTASIYFPVAGKEHIKIEADAANFGKFHSLKGSPTAEIFAAIDSIVASSDDIAALQRTLTGFITTDTTGIVAYYTVQKSVGSVPVFDPADPMGNRVWGAAANTFAAYNPLDPRGQMLKQMFFLGRKVLGKLPENETVYEANETGLIDIARYDTKGVEHKLSDVCGKGAPVLLSFTAYALQPSPAYNAILFDLYDKYKDQGFQIYQISFDPDEVAWREAARSIPWIAVWNSPSDGENIMAQYNVGALPLTYIINKNGDIGERIINPEDLPKAIQKYF